MPSIPINQVNRGQAIRWNGEIYAIIGMDHVKPGKGPAYQQTKMRNVQTGKIIENRFRSEDRVEMIDVDRQGCSYSYQSGDNYIFMNDKTYEEIEVHESILGDDKYYLLDGVGATVMIAEGRVLGIELPASVVMTVTECDPGVKNATATNVFKNGVVETGLNVQIPPFINVGDKVKINTADGTYLERVAIG
ncbi:MAG: elongation factor P [Planctomycetes bacterium]|nr:elongation factor P [Planctomycetota bacterium]